MRLVVIAKCKSLGQWEKGCLAEGEIRKYFHYGAVQVVPMLNRPKVVDYHGVSAC